MKKLLTIISLLIFIQAKAQTPSWSWARCSKTGNDTTSLGEGWCNAADSVGNNYVGGTFKDTLIFGIDTLTESIGLTAFVAKYDAFGNIMWARQPKGNAYSWIMSIASDNSGNVYVAGYFKQAPIAFDTIVLNLIGGHDMFLVKYDNLGSVVWAKVYGGVAGFTELRDIATDIFGNIYAVGEFSSPTINFDSHILTNTDSTSWTTDFFLTKFDSNGNTIWARSGKGAANELGKSLNVSQDPSANVYIVGNFASTNLIIGNDTLVNVISNNTADIFTDKYDSNGNLLWAKGGGGIDQDYAYASALDATGNFYISGQNYSTSITFDSYTLFNPNSFLVKYNPLGNVEWVKAPSFGTAGITCMAFNSYDKLLLIGDLFSDTIAYDTIFMTSTFNTDDMFIVEMNSSGDALWGEAYPFGGDDVVAIACDSFGNAFVGGDFVKSVLIVGNDTLINTVEETPFQAKLHFYYPTGIAEIITNIESVLYPNPITNELNIKTNINQPTVITLYDITSRKLLQETFTTTTTLNTTQLASGIYIYEVRNKNGVLKQGKVIKE